VNLTAIRERVAIDSVRLAPKGLYTAAIGWGARRTLPRMLRRPVYSAFARAVGASLDEAELPLDQYPTFGDFFARRLRPDARPSVKAADALACPCDGTVAAVGLSDGGTMVQAKGRDYRLDELVCDAELAERLEGGYYLTIYLSPRDYHRVHAPVAGDLIGFDYVPGALFPVNPLFSRHVDALMSRNERVVLRLETALGTVALVMVAAVGVGNMRLEHAGVDSNRFRRRQALHRHRFPAPVPLARGDELGAFHLGSTVILIFEPGRATLDGLSAGDLLRVGQSIGRRVEAQRRPLPGSRG
jgi:phosphatidylserine decarboxylase